jgi:hypothetical protein
MERDPSCPFAVPRDLGYAAAKAMDEGIGDQNRIDPDG